MQNSLKKADDKNHDNYFGYLVFELIERMDFENLRTVALFGLINLGDKKLIGAKTEDEQDNGDQEEVNRTDDSRDDIFMQMFRMGMVDQKVPDHYNNGPDIKAGNNEKNDRSDHTENDGKYSKKPTVPECTFKDFFKHICLLLLEYYE